MAYIVSSTEKLRKPAAVMETKALLYLMNFCVDSDEIHYFVVDFFNDLTGMDMTSSKLWDIQSKGASNSSPKQIGRELVTLYKNYLSTFTFYNYILFLGGVSPTLRIDGTKNIFNVNNIKTNAKKKIIEGLLEECNEKTYIDDNRITNANIDEFISEVTFVIDDKESSEYVKAIIGDYPQITPDNDTLNAIFNEIRDTQSSKKNGSTLEGVTLSTCDESLNYYRHLTNNEIRLMTLQRIINRDPLSKGTPLPFLPILNQCPPESKPVMIDECTASLCRALFNKNAAQNFWELFEQIYLEIISNPTFDVQSLYLELDKDLVKNCPDFDTLSLKYFISVIKEGIQ